MQLKDYLAKREQTQQDFADILGVSREMVNKYINKPIFPNANHLNKIKEITSGKVELQDFCENCIDKITILMDLHNVRLKNLASLLNTSEVTIHKKLKSKTLVQWELELIAKYINGWKLYNKKEKQKA